jgi:HrpA-like RNA helicase
MKPNYENACVYKLCCKNPEIKECYVGSTCNFRVRKYKHKSMCTNPNGKEYNYYVYRFIRENGNWENWTMIELEKVNCNDCKTLHKIEREWLEKLQASLNSLIPSRTSKEYYQDNKKKIKEWREDNKEKILEKRKEYREKNKEKIKEKRNKKYICICGLGYTLTNKSHHFKAKRHRKIIAKIKKPLHIELLKLF